MHWVKFLAGPYEGVKFPTFLMNLVGSLRNNLGMYPKNSNSFFMINEDNLGLCFTALH